MTERKFDLEHRTAKFGEAVIRFSNNIPRETATKPLITQFVKSGTSIGANYCEADDAESLDDFCHKLSICKKEARETMYWFRMIAAAVPNLKNEARLLWREAKELNLILNAIVRKCRTNQKK